MASGESGFESGTKIDWYRTPIDRAELKALMRRSDLRGACQTVAHLGWFLVTASLAYAAYLHLDENNWPWGLPLLLAALFLHGTMGPFMGLIAIHELMHRTVFRTRWLNECFEVIYAFISWSDYVWYQVSHPAHHMGTCYARHDGEVVLPQRFSISNWRVWLGLLAWHPGTTWARLKTVWAHAHGRVYGDWYAHVLPQDDVALRRRHMRWARILLWGHAGLAIVFIATGHWFLIVVFTLGTHYCGWLGFLCGLPQHYGLKPNVPDFRLNTRTFTCSWIPAFYYWNMQYHLEHHMYPAVPFYNLPRLRAQLAHDLPPAPHGLVATWRHMLEIRGAALADPSYQYVPELPGQADSPSV